MGLAASQCRLLLLTAKLSDTEYRAQTISQRRMALAMQTEQIATEYTRKINNRILKHVFALDANENNTTLKESLTYYTLTANNSALGGGQLRVVLPDGRIAVPSVDKIPGVVGSSKDDNGNAQYVTKSHIQEFLAGYTGNNEAITALINKELTNEEYAQVYEYIKNEPSFKEILNQSSTPSKIDETSGSAVVDGIEYVVIPALANTEFFQNALRTGSIFVERYNENFAENDGWESYDIINSPFVEDVLNTEDDAAAQAEYDAKTAMIQSQDKRLEMELKQVETQHQAAQTEYDQVKKVMDKNIERSFKTFG